MVMKRRRKHKPSSNDTNLKVRVRIPHDSKIFKKFPYIYQSVKEEKIEEYQLANTDIVPSRVGIHLKDPNQLIIRKSNISGRGVFTTSVIGKGVKILDYGGELIDKAEKLRRESEYDKWYGNFYFYGLQDEKHFIDATMKGNMARYINHSCDPNCEVIEVVTKKKIRIRAIRRISIMEELTLDYKLENATDRCKCGSSKCTGIY